MKQILGFHVLKELCEKHDVIIKQLAGSTSVHSTFTLISKSERIDPTRVFGSCRGTEIALSLISMDTQETFDLSDPNSIDEIEKFLTDRYGT